MPKGYRKSTGKPFVPWCEETIAARKRRLPLPNLDSKVKTPATTLIDKHYADLQIRWRWTWDRYTRLAAFLDYTPAELASVICLRHVRLDTAKRENRFTGPACLLLTLLEARAMRNLSTDIIANPFNFHDPPQSP